MIQRASLLLAVFLLVHLPRSAFAQEEDDGGDMEFTVEEAEEGAQEEPEEPPTELPDTDLDLGLEEDAKAAGPKGGEDEALGETRVSWQDIVVVMRKPFLKANRIELVPFLGLTINDNMIRHFALNGSVNWFLTDVLAVGVEAQIFEKDFLETFDLVARQHRRLPTLNRYNFGASFNFHYTPIYGKFAIFNNKIVHWEWFFTAGVGVTQSEVIPRDPALPGWNNLLITPNIGVTMRVFLADWLTLNLGVRDYIFVDKFEDVNRNKNQSLDTAMSEADGKLINHIMFQAGVSFWIPPSFEYTTFR